MNCAHRNGSPCWRWYDEYHAASHSQKNVWEDLEVFNRTFLGAISDARNISTYFIEKENVNFLMPGTERALNG